MKSTHELTVLLMSGSWYEENAYMTLLSRALRDHGIEVRTPDLLLFFPLTRTVLRNRDADVMQLDWIYDYYATGDLESRRLNDLVSYLRAAAFLLDLLAVSLLDVRVVRTVHNKRSHEGIYPRTERIVSECVFWVADAITVKCSAAAAEIAAAYRVPEAEELSVVPDGNYIDAYENDVSRATARSDLGIDDASFVFLFFGQVRPYKGVPELVEAFSSLDFSDAELWIVGSPYTDDIEARITTLAAADPRIETRLSYVPDDRIQYYLNAADVLTLPYRKILNSGSAHLGLSFATPIVAPKIGCLPETIPPENDLLYDPAADGLVRALRRAYESPDLDSVGRANHQRARTLNWDRTCELLLDVYAE
ncbi:glycosyltransferase family 4 protein [Halobellus rarus]|uniref:Glycosyltransferase family 4 protein n=1 Tax=Halobellus rarus TaxID=1126237 RepID=A0ABD6CSL5_9EURY|nr:glycosyltransferase family 4 protein [Halobellus rarus]